MFGEPVSRRQFLGGVTAAGLYTTVSTSASFSRLGSPTSSPVLPVPEWDSRVDLTDPIITLGHGIPFVDGRDGWPEVNELNYISNLRDLHPDFWNQRYILGLDGPPFLTGVASSARKGATTGAKMQLPTSVGMHWDTIAVPEDKRPKKRRLTGWIASLKGNNRWIGPDGKPTEQPLEVTAARDIYNGVSKQSRHGGSEIAYNLSIHSPNTFQLKSTIGEQIVLWGANVVEFDGALKAGRLMRGDFSEWAVQDFQNWLQSLPSDRVNELGIDSPDSFHIRSYVQNLLASIQSGRKSRQAVVEDQILYEFFLMEHQQILTFYQRFSDHVKATGGTVNSQVNVLANQGGGVIDTRGAASVIISQAFDAIEVEGAITVPGQPESTDPYRTDIRTPRHKLTAARARVTDKPPVEHGFYGTLDSKRELETGRPYPVLQTLNFAETYANGSRRQLDITGWANLDVDDISLFWWDPDNGIPDRLQQLADFLWTHEDELRAQPNSNIAIVYSLPTLIAKARRAFGRSLAPERMSVYGFVRALREAQLPSDIVIFGHPTLWDDSSTLNRLNDYDVLLCPGVTALTDAQVEALQSFLSAGGTIIHEGSFATRDSRYRRRDGNPFSEYSNRIQSTDGAARAIVPDGDPSSVTQPIANALDTELVRVDEDYPLTVEVTATESKQVIHLLNYGYDTETDTVDPFTNVELSVRAPDFELKRAYANSPTGEYEELDIQQAGGRVRITVPEVSVWTIVVLDSQSVPSSKALKPVFETASNMITKAKEQGRNMGVIEAQSALREAKIAADAAQPERSRTRAERAITAAKQAYDRPRIGIDSGHGQQDKHSFTALEEFRSAMRDELTVEFVEVTDFSEETLRTLDALIIGQPIAEGASFSLPNDDIQKLKRFVEQGGGLGIFAQPYRRPIPDLNRLVSEFGFEINFRPLHKQGNPDNYFVPIDVTQYRTPLTYQFIPQNINLACSIDIHDKSVETAVTTEDSAYRQGEPEKIAAFPILVSTTHGDGRVACSTNSRMLTTPKYGRRVLGRNILHWISSPGQRRSASQNTPTPTNTVAQSPTPSSRETTSKTTTTKSSPNTTTPSKTTGAQSPGFGIWATLAGLGSATSYLIHKKRNNGSDDKLS